MILQSLVRYYQRVAAQPKSGLAPYGYSPEKISYEIRLRSDGSVIAVQSIQDTTGKKPRPRMLTVPQPEKRTAGIKPNFLWDKTSYVLGISATSKRAVQEHAAFKALHLDALAGETDAGLVALCRFLQQWAPDQFEALGCAPEVVDTNVVFRFEDENTHLHDRPAAQAVRARLLAASPALMDEAEAPATGQTRKSDKAADSASLPMCLVTGDRALAARLHPKIKEVNGAQTAGASIVSFNQEAFTSYGKDQGDNAPVSEQAAFAYTTALNHLLRRGPENRQRLQIGDASVVFWAEAADSAQAEAAEQLLANFFGNEPDDAEEAEKMRRVLDVVAKGRPMTEAALAQGLDPSTRMFVLGLAPNAARLSIRFWLVDSLQHFMQQLAQHELDMRIRPCPWKIAPAARRIVLASVPNREGSMPKAEDAPENLIGETMRAILTGGHYPLSLLSNTVMRIRTDGTLNGMRAAICKGVLTRRHRLLKNTSYEEIPVSLDTQTTQPAYLLGRLFAVLENVQRSALGERVNATIRDRYYGAASATPASIFPVLLRNTQNHLSKLRKDRPGQAVNLEKQLREIIDGLPQQFPRSFNIEDQGRFAIGYYHQSQAYFSKSASSGSATVNADATKIEQGEPA